MRLIDATNAVVEYPDRAAPGTVCIEIASQAGIFGYEILREEIEVLAAAGLIIQLEIGLPVVKLLNITDVLNVSREGGGDVPLASTFNFIGMLTSQGENMMPEAVVATAIERYSGDGKDRLVRFLDELSRTLRFVRAVNGNWTSPSLQRPSIHLSIDSRVISSAPKWSDPDSCAEFPVLRRALCWQPGLANGEERLLNSSAVREDDYSLGGAGDVLVPLPFARSSAERARVSGCVEQQIRSVAGKSAQVGFSMSCDISNDVMESEYAEFITRVALDAVFRYVDRGAVGTR